LMWFWDIELFWTRPNCFQDIKEQFCHNCKGYFQSLLKIKSSCFIISACSRLGVRISGIRLEEEPVAIGRQGTFRLNI